MRISIKKDDPGYREDFVLCNCTIDGMPEARIITADDTKRYALIYARDRNGKLMRNPDGDIQTLEVTGDIKFDLSGVSLTWLQWRDEPAGWYDPKEVKVP